MSQRDWSKTASNGVIATLVFVVFIGMGLELVSRLAPMGDMLRSQRLVPVMIYRPPFFVGLILGIIATVLISAAIALFASRPSMQIATAAGSFAVAITAGLLVFSSIVPEWGTLGSQSIARIASTETRSDKTFALVVLFDRGSAELTPSAQQTLTDSLAVFQSCALSDVQIRGFSSRRPFRPSSKRDDCDSDCRNNGLANERALSVHRHLQELGIESTPPIPWLDHNERLAATRILDSVDGKFLSDKEKLNQRAEVFWRQSECGGVQATTSGR